MAACTCRYKYVLGANDRKMQRSSSNGNNNTASKLFVAPRDHFLDNAGMSESDSDSDLIEEGMLIEAPVTPEKSPPAGGLEGGAVPANRQQAATEQEGSEEASAGAEVGVGEEDAGAGAADEAVDKEQGMGSIPAVPSIPQVLPFCI